MSGADRPRSDDAPQRGGAALELLGRRPPPGEAWAFRWQNRPRRHLVMCLYTVDEAVVIPWQGVA
jgi:hypothetical protein